MPLCRVCHKSVLRIVHRRYSVAQITIPNRIKRTPTELLEALASTVGADNKFSPDYRYTDDPALTPTSNMERRKMALALEHGRRAARYFASEWPTLFMYDEDVPRLNVFRPPGVLSASTAPLNVESLDTFVKERQVTDAITFYPKLRDENVQIPINCKLELMELLAYYNHMNPPAAESDHPEEVLFSTNLTASLKTPWNENGLAEELFVELESEAPDAAYSILICGLGQHFAGERANTMFNEMMQKGLKPSFEVLETIIASTFYMDNDPEEAWTRIKGYLHYMKENKMTPRLTTFNIILQFFTKNRRLPWMKTAALDLLDEMRECAVEPSVSSYKMVAETMLNLPIRDTLLSVLVDKMEQNPSLMKMQDDGDRHLMPWLMQTLTNERRMADQQFIFRVAELAQHKDCELFCETSVTNSFCVTFLMYLIGYQPLDVFFKWYNEMVPLLFTPTRSLLDKMVMAVEMDGAFEHVPRLWKDALTYGALFSNESVAPLLALVNTALTAEAAVPNRKDIVDCVFNWAEIIDKQYVGEGRVYLHWDVPLLTSTATVLAIGGFGERAWDLMNRIDSDPGAVKSETSRKWNELTLLGSPTGSDLKLLLQSILDSDVALLHKFDRVIHILKLSSSYRLTITAPLAQMATQMPLSPNQLKMVKVYA